MALLHTFHLIPSSIDIQNFFMTTKNNDAIIDSVKIHDDMITYIYDSLNWIPSRNPALRDMPNGQGIHYHGITLFDEHSSEALLKIFTAWRDLFSNAPDIFQLKGPFIINRDEHEILYFSRNEIIDQFETMISMSNYLADGNYYLYHCGI
jgi:hypothetical protein